MKKLLISLIILSFTATATMAAALRADAKTKRIPAGATFQLEFLQPVSTYSGGAGDSFVATLKNEQSSGTSVILPAGTVVRGSIAEIKTAKRALRAGDFKHAVNSLEKVPSACLDLEYF